MIRVFILSISLLLFSCTDSNLISDVEFKNKLQEYKDNSAVSLWYLGENDDVYFLSERTPLATNIYQISKSSNLLIRIKHFEYNSGEKPVNLKLKNIVTDWWPH